MNEELSPQYDPQAVESRIYALWREKTRDFHAVPGAAGSHKFSMVIPPPNVTGALHLGHAINGTIQDILARYHRMCGDNTLWMPGIDHAGIATQAVVERTIFEQEKKSRHDLGREELVRRIWQWKENFGERILEQLKRMGASCDWNRTRFTLDDLCARAVREAFFKLFQDGLIFRGFKLIALRFELAHLVEHLLKHSAVFFNVEFSARRGGDIGNAGKFRNQDASRIADRFRRHVLIRAGRFTHRMHVHTAFVGEGAGADVRLVVNQIQIRHFVHIAGGLG